MNNNKALNMLKNVLSIALIIAAVGMMIFTIVSVTTFDRTDRSLFGYRAFIVLSDSMSASGIEAGDLAIIEETNPAEIEAGDIIAFISTDSNNYGEVVTHMVRQATVDENGNPGFITYGTTTGTDDAAIVTYEYILGECTTSIPNVGSFFMFLKTVPGYFLCIFLPFMILILMQGVNTIKLFKQYKAEQLEELEAEKASHFAEVAAERERLEAEKLEAQKVMEELEMLRAKLAEQEASKTDEE